MRPNAHHANLRHSHPHSQANHFNTNFHARQAQSISISDPLPIPTLPGFNPSGAVETVTATGSKLVLPSLSSVPVDDGGQSAVTVITTTTRAMNTPSSIATSAASNNSVSSSDSHSFSSDRSGSDNLSIPVVIGICIGVFVGLVLFILCVVWWTRSKRSTQITHGQHRGAGGNGGSFEQITSRNDIDGPKGIMSGVDASGGGATKRLDGSVRGMEKPPSYESFAEVRALRAESSRVGLMVPDMNANSQLSPISPSSTTEITSRSTSPAQILATEPGSSRISYTETLQTLHGQILSVPILTHDYYQHPHSYVSASPLLSAYSSSSTSTRTPPDSATAFAKSADGSGAHSVFGAMQAQYRETGALLEGRSPTNSAIPTPTSTPTCSTHATFITAASELRFDSSLGMSDTFHDRSSLHTYSTLDPDASYTAPSDDDDEHSHSYLMMRNSNSDLTLQNLQMPPEAKSPAFRFDFRQAHLMEHEGEVVTSTASTSVIESESAEVRAGNGMVMVGLGSRMDLYEAGDMAESSRTTIYSPPSPSSTRPPFSNAHKRSATSETITITNKNLFSYTHGHALPKLDIDSQNPSLPPAQTHIPGHKHTRMASLLAALDIPVTPSTETHSGFDTGADADTDTDAYEETETETDVDTEVFPMPPASVVSAIR